MKQKDFLLTVNSQNSNDFLSLTSQYGQPAVQFSVNSNGGANSFVVTSRDDLMHIAEFLQQRCEAEEQPIANGPNYETTGMGLCIMDYSGKVLAAYYGKSEHGMAEDIDSWSYESLQQHFPNQNAIYVLFELYDKAFGRQVITKVIQACIALQARFVATGLPMHCRRMIQQDVAELARYDMTVVSRVTQHVRIFTPRKTFTLDNDPIPSLETPSLFDPGSSQYDLSVSRLEVVEAIKELIDNENPARPLGDEAITKELHSKGYQIARRTVVKYRDEFLGMPNSNQRRRHVKQ